MSPVQTPSPRPPRWADWLAGVRLPADRREFVLGDLGEEFDRLVLTAGARTARRWYWRQVWRTVFSRHPQTLTAPGGPTPGRPNRMAPFMPDLRYSIRSLRRQPGFAVAAILTLALGIGANAAVFRVAWQVLLKPLPYPEAGRLVRVWESYSRNGHDLINTVAPGNFVDWRAATTSFEATGAYSAMRSTMDLTGAGDPVQLETRFVTGDFFRTFNIPPLVGRVLTADDTNGTSDVPPVVLSEHLWRRIFGGQPAIVGHPIRLGGSSHPVIGVMPEAFGVEGGATTDVWMGTSLVGSEASNHGGHYLGVVARLKPGVTVPQAIADVQAAAREDSRRFPASNKDTSATVEAMTASRGKALRSGLALLAGAAAFVLLIACANLAGLQLARGLARRREFGIRTALGASRARLVRLLLVESAVLALLGAAAGLTLSSWVLGLLAHVAPTSLRAATETPVEWPALACAGLLAALSVVLFASLPAWRAATQAATGIHQRAATTDRRTTAIRTLLVTSQLALATVLVVGATLLVGSLALVLRVDPGFEPRGVLAFDLSLPWPFADRQAALTHVFDTLGALPGVRAACAINAVPFDESFNMTYVPEGPHAVSTAPVGAYPRTVTPGCFEVLRLPLVAGRLFTDHEQARVGIVTESFANLAWGHRSPVGERVHFGIASGPLIEIVGVVADSRQVSLERRPYPQFYEVFSAQSGFPPASVLVRTDVPPASLFSTLRAAIHQIDPDQPVGRLRTLDAIVGASTAERQFDLGLLAGFAAIALVLAAVGTYGLFAQLVAERRGEIGIRMALGAVPSRVVRLMLHRAWWAVGAGVAVGVGGALVSAAGLEHLLYGLSPTDPWVYASVAATLSAVALVAAWMPARRAARVDPVSALRDL